MISCVILSFYTFTRYPFSYLTVIRTKILYSSIVFPLILQYYKVGNFSLRENFVLLSWNEVWSPLLLRNDDARDHVTHVT